jgi:hypothetical protein
LRQSTGIEDQTASRCWPHQDRFDCITISFDPGGSSVATVTAQRHSEERRGDFDVGLPGYSCYASNDHVFGIRYVEEIVDAARNTLLQNFDSEEDPSTRGWSETFVRQFVSENHIPSKGRFFNCSGLRRLLDVGSPLTLGTTAAVKEWFF